MASFFGPAPLRSVRALMFAAALLCAPGCERPARASGDPLISTSEPEGFADLTRDRELLVDVYFGGVRRGEAMVTATPDTLVFRDPAEVIALLPSIVDAASVQRALVDRPLPTHAELVCTPGSDKTLCGKLAPEVVGVILDKDRFRVDIFLNPRFLVDDERFAERYIPAPDGALTMISAIGGVLSGRTGDGGQNYNLQDRLIMAWGNKRVRADLGVVSGFGFEAERLALEWDQPERRYSGGVLWAPGEALTGRRKLLGLGIETQIDTRRDREALLGSPVIVFLDRRARVDVRHRGRVLSSAIYEAGNRQIDTSNLPEGSYEITLWIEEAGQPAREERRFYTKSRQIPSLGRTDFFAFGGLLMNDRDPGSLAVSSRPYAQGGLAHRLSESWALDSSVQASDRSISAELGVSFLASIVQARGAALAGSTGTKGALVQLRSTGQHPFNFNLDMRHVEDAGLPNPSLSSVASALRDGRIEEDGDRHSYSQIGGVVSYSLATVRLLGTFYYRDEAGEDARYSLGPAIEWDVFRHDALSVTLRADLTATQDGETGFAGISLRFTGRRASAAALAGIRSGSMSDDNLGDGLVGTLAGSWNTDAMGGELAFGAGYERQPGQETLIASSEFEHPFGSLSGDLARSSNGTASTTQYSVGFQTTLAAGVGGVRVAGRTTTGSMIVARVDGARPQDRFEVLVDEQAIAMIRGDEPAVLNLPSYRAYKVRIRPVGDSLLAYDSSSRELGLFPGVVAHLEWAASPVTIKIGRLVDPSGMPVRGASIVGKGVWSQTNEEGYFQIEVPDNLDLEAVLPDGRRFSLELPTGRSSSGIARLGSITCCGDSGIMLGAADLPTRSFDNGR